MNTRAFLLTAPRKIELVDVELPRIGDDEILCRTECTAISPGTYLQRFLGTQPGMPEFPCIPGYLNVARVAEVGSGARDRGFAAGDVVHVRSFVKRSLPYAYCNGTDAEYVVVGESGLPYVTHVRQYPKHLAFAIFGHLGFSATVESECGPGSTALVVGQGILGLGCTRAFALAGARQIVTVDRIPRRREIARKLGATHTHAGDDPLVEALAAEYPGGFDIVVEATGNPTVLEDLPRLSKSGDVYLVSLYQDAARVVFGNFKQRRIIGLPRGHWWLNLLHNTMDTGVFMVDEIISDVIPPTAEDMRWAYQALLDEPAEHLGILVDWTGATTQRTRVWQ